MEFKLKIMPVCLTTLIMTYRLTAIQCTIKATGCRANSMSHFITDLISSQLYIISSQVYQNYNYTQGGSRVESKII